ncbi:MAG: hypothetical protein LLF94_02035 [Chlamydiales bacterium]|nr:hypothetical protein [Chlamydiales bacterium]
MYNHQFMFEPGDWLGTGQVTFTVSPELLYFRTKWSCVRADEETYQCTQTVEIIGGDRMVNVFTLKPYNKASFDIVLQNEVLGVFSGLGVVEENLVAWEFRTVGTFEGYEVYEKVHDEEYAMHAEYLSSDGARTRISGKIWKASDMYEDSDEEQNE